MVPNTLELAEALASRGDVQLALESAFMTLVNLFAIVGNVSVCYAIYRNQHLRNLSNMFVIALAVADLAMASLCTPFSVATLVSSRWLFGSHWCALQGFFAFTSGLASLLIRGLISVSRYFCIVRNAKYQVIFTKRSTVLYILLMWVIALVDSLPPFFALPHPAGYNFQPGKAMCLFTFEFHLGYTLVTEICFIGLPLLVIFVCYTKVFLNVNRTNRVFASAGNVENLQAHVREAKISKTLAVVIGGFAICWLPISIIDTIDAVTGTLAVPREVYLTYTFLAYGSCTLNPIIYGIMNKAFRREYGRIVRSIFRFRRSTDPGSRITQSLRMEGAFQSTPRLSGERNSPETSPRAL